MIMIPDGSLEHSTSVIRIEERRNEETSHLSGSLLSYEACDDVWSGEVCNVQQHDCFM